VRTKEEGGLWALIVWMSLGSAGAVLSLVMPGELAYFGWALAVLAAIVVGANCAFRLLETRLKEPSSKPAAAPSVAQSLRDAGVEEEWVREYVEKPLAMDAQSLISVPNPDGSKTYYAREQRRDGGWSVHRVPNPPSSDSVKHLRQEVARSRQSQTVIYRPPRMHLHRRPLRYDPRRKEPEDDPWYRRKDPE